MCKLPQGLLAVNMKIASCQERKEEGKGELSVHPDREERSMKREEASKGR